MISLKAFFGRAAAGLMFFAIPVLACCTDDNEAAPETSDGTGSIVIKAKTSSDVNVHTRTSTDLKDYFVILEYFEEGKEPAVETIPFPHEADGKITGLKTGDYRVTVTSHPDGFDGPAFGEPVYEDSANVTVIRNKPTDVTLTCVQANTGVVFEYDLESLQEAGLEEILPTVANRNDNTRSLS